MPAINITDLNNAKLDVDHIAAVATSPAYTTTDRLGNTKKTMAGAIESIAAITNRGAWVTASIRGQGSRAGVQYLVYLCRGHMSSAAFATDTLSKWRVYQGVSADDLAASTGAELVGNGGESVAATLSALQLADYAALRAYVGLRKVVYVTGYLATKAPSGIPARSCASIRIRPAWTTAAH